MITRTIQVFLLWVFASSFGSCLSFAEDSLRIDELDAYWEEVARSVNAGDFEAYKATCHPEGVLISEKKGTSYPLVRALEIWKPGFLDTKAGKKTAEVEFRFSKRWGNATTAYEVGMFRFSGTDKDGKAETVYIHLEATLIKKDRWLILLEHQKSAGTIEDWEKLK